MRVGGAGGRRTSAEAVAAKPAGAPANRSKKYRSSRVLNAIWQRSLAPDIDHVPQQGKKRRPFVEHNSSSRKRMSTISPCGAQQHEG